MSASVRQSPRFARSKRWALYIVAVGVWLSGGLWLLFHHFFVEQGEFDFATLNWPTSILQFGPL